MFENLYEKAKDGLAPESVEPKILGAMGLARRAGKLEIGAELCEEAIRAGRAEITFLASNLTDNSKKKLMSALRVGDSPYIILNVTKEELAERFGKKAFAVALSITDKGFAKIVYKALGISE
jgi:ribosomal protein L7Ae-like RNA K-turn-binding protein